MVVEREVSRWEGRYEKVMPAKLNGRVDASRCVEAWRSGEHGMYPMGYILVMVQTALSTSQQLMDDDQAGNCLNENG